MSNISVTVEWDQPTVFAGEELRCKITFRNATISARSRSPSPISQQQTVGTGRDRWKLGHRREAFTPNSPLQASEPELCLAGLRSHSHRSTISLSAPIGTLREHSGGATGLDAIHTTQTPKHSRSVSIISIGSQQGTGEDSTAATSKRVQRAQKAHGRSASFQGLPFTNGSQSNHGNASPLTGATFPSSCRSSTSPYPLQRSATSKHERGGVFDTTTGHDLSLLAAGDTGKKLVQHARSDSDTRGVTKQHEWITNIPARLNGHAERQAMVSKAEKSPISKEHPVNRSVQRVISPLSMEGTPRSSVDLYNQSNNSSETLASEYITSSFRHQPASARHIRQGSRLSPVGSSGISSDTLMMGYAQLVGSFALDGSLVALSPFEAVKRKGVIGGQGSGGVVGIEHSKRESGLLGSLGWANIGQSIGGFLGAQEPSSIREMKGLASTKSIPILSTPQSILFVDLKLKPGESRTYSYCHVLPSGLPPTHKGRSLKSSYQLVVGVQRPQATGRQHTVRQVEVPFRVLPGITGLGNVLGHDLMNPHIVLDDLATIYNLDEPSKPLSLKHSKNGKQLIDGGFMNYANYLLHKSRQKSNLGLLSPMEPLTPSDGSYYENLSMKERIDRIILRGGTHISEGRPAANKFQIHRDGTRIANVTLGRCVYRLGETVTSTIDMASAHIPCYAVNISLETSEIIDPLIAVRSEASIQRATRRVHASSSEIAVSAKRIVFGTIIPLNATPEFMTSGMRLEWRLRIEFITRRNANADDSVDGLLEEVNEDERGTIEAAVQELPCQSFDIAIPIRVYGVAKVVDDGTKPQVYSI